MASFRRGDWYKTPLYYDIVFDEGTGTEADFLEAVYQRHVLSGGNRVLEPACGTGRLVVELAKRGYRVSGFDAEEAMLEFAELRLIQEKVRAELWRDRLESFDVSCRFDLAFCLLSTFKYLPGEAEAVEHLRRVAACLAPGGVYVLGVHVTDYARQRPEHERWVGERDGVRVVCNTRTWPADRPARRERIRSRLIAEVDGVTDRVESEWWCRTYDADELERTLTAAAGFEVVGCYDFRHDTECRAELCSDADDVVLVLRRSE